MEMSFSEPVPDDKEEELVAVLENKLTLDNLAECPIHYSTTFDFLYNMHSSHMLVK